MRRQFRIVVHATPRTHPDPTLLAQIVILLGRHLHHHQQQGRAATGHAKTQPGGTAPRQRHKSEPRTTRPASAPPRGEDTPPTPKGDGGGAGEVS